MPRRYRRVNRRHNRHRAVNPNLVQRRVVNIVHRHRSLRDLQRLQQIREPQFIPAYFSQPIIPLIADPFASPQSMKDSIRACWDCRKICRKIDKYEPVSPAKLRAFKDHVLHDHFKVCRAHKQFDPTQHRYNLRSEYCDFLCKLVVPPMIWIEDVYEYIVKDNLALLHYQMLYKEQVQNGIIHGPRFEPLQNDSQNEVILIEESDQEVEEPERLTTTIELVLESTQSSPDPFPNQNSHADGYLSGANSSSPELLTGPYLPSYNFIAARNPQNRQNRVHTDRSQPELVILEDISDHELQAESDR